MQTTNGISILQIKNTQVSVCNNKKKEELIQFDQFDEDLIPKSKLFSPMNVNLNLKCVENYGNNKIYDINETGPNEQQNKSDQLLDQLNSKQRMDTSLLQVNVMTERLNNQNLIFYAPQYIPDVQHFLTQPVPVDKIVQCTLIKNKKGFCNFYPKFELYFSESLKFLCAGKRQSTKRKSNYIISSNVENFNSNNKSVCIGNLKYGTIENSFYLYDNGNDPNKSGQLETTRREYAVYFYKKSSLGLKSINVLIPSVINGQPQDFKPITQNQGIQKAFSQSKNENVMQLVSRPPTFSEEKNAYQLKFTQRVRAASNKNFIIISNNQQNDEEFILQFGKCGDEYYNLDICHPLSILQAFALCITQFEIKLK
ncbi:unnamed protein product [Paramecium pentaurelia]|uniref:Tubby C-terminal domain-containing protein n=1 Tax=Paramecium pentaurelia TaxID=43138 RepID=A0A8S1X8W4_9CILI|nr:unnamed protein product [Paramecium pentaurelia]